MNENDLKWLCSQLDVIDEYELRSDDWEQIEVEKIGGSTENGVFVNNDNFLPFSQAKCDFEKNIYIRSWLLRKWN